MKRAIEMEKLKEQGLAAFELTLQLAQDQEFRERFSSAFEHSRRAGQRALPV